MSAMPDGRDGPESSGAALPDGLVVPDDASSLDFDRLALLRERAQARRRARLERIFFTRRFRAYGISGPIVSLCLLVVFIFAALLALVVPDSGNGRVAAKPLATSTVAAGRVGSLLPAEVLQGLGRVRTDMPSRDLRPGVVMLIPASCDTSTASSQACADAVRNVTTTARDFNLKTYLVSTKAVTNLLALAEAPASADTYAIPLLDPTGAVLAPFPLAAMPTAVLVAPDGTVSSVLPGVTAGTSVTPAFVHLNGLA